MSTLNSLQFAASLAAESNFNARIDDDRTVNGAVKYATLVVPLPTANVAGNVINLVQLPPGCIVLPELSTVLVTGAATAGALTLDVGDSVDPDRYADGINAAAVGSVPFTSVVSTTVPAALKTRHKVEDATRIVTLTLATLTGSRSAGELIVVLAFKAL